MTNDKQREWSFKKEDIESAVYDIFYKNSSVDGVRICYEDNWPIEDIADFIEALLDKTRKEVAREIIKDIQIEIDEGFSDWLDTGTMIEALKDKYLKD